MSSDVRKAQNEALFREANEEIRRVQLDLGLADRRMPFICECDDETCREILRLTAEEYERVRAGGTLFFVAPEHPTEGRIVERRDGYCISRKEGPAAEIAEAADPRKEG
jgi:hypothetical protein